MLHGASLVSEGRRRVAVIVQPAHPARIAPLLMAAYELTERDNENRVIEGQPVRGGPLPATNATPQTTRS